MFLLAPAPCCTSSVKSHTSHTTVCDLIVIHDCVRPYRYSRLCVTLSLFTTVCDLIVIHDCVRPYRYSQLCVTPLILDHDCVSVREQLQSTSACRIAIAKHNAVAGILNGVRIHNGVHILTVVRAPVAATSVTS